MNSTEESIKNSELLSQTDDIAPLGDEEVRGSLASKITGFLRSCWQKRKMVFAIIAVGVSISLVDALLLTNVYTASTSILPSDNATASSSLMSMMSSSGSGAAASLGSQMLGLDTPGELFVSILGSRNVMDGVITRFNLIHYYKARDLEDARQSLKGDADLQVDRKSGVITVSVTLADPVLAANVAQGAVTELNRVLTEDSTSSARRERIFLEGRLKDIKQELDESSKALSQFSSKSGAIDMPTQAKSMVDAGLRLQTDLISGRSQLAGLRQTYAEDNPRVRAVEARNAELQRQIDAMGGLNQQPGLNPDSKSESYPSVSKLSSLGLTYYDLERKVQVDEALWEALTRQYELAKVEEAEQTPAARVLDVAEVPVRKSGPSRRLAVMIGTALSVLVACIAVVTQNVWEGMDAQDEPKKLILEMVQAVMDRRRWYWSLPGMKRDHGRPA